MLFIAGHKGLADWLFATGIGLAGLPLSFLLWHRNLYKAAINNGTMRWLMFLMFNFLHIVLAGWIAVAPPIVGKWSAGGFTMINEFKRGTGGRGQFVQ
ncbi:hypothetical protein WJX72_012303 [[Myrmecia] bisecta]|uniref:Secretory carrier-associated membrane protein n=1 Tax=[Myrmecia] bisecta TaxID=41462 RepID=A0AAW1PBB7_9CHLO